MAATLIVDDPELPTIISSNHLPTSEGWKDWVGLAVQGGRSAGIRSTGNWTRVTGMVAQWFTSYATATNRAGKKYLWKKIQPSRQILVPRTSRGRAPPTSPGRPPPTSPGRPLKILFDHPGDVLIWRPGDVPTRRSGDVLKWRPGVVLIRRSRDVPGRMIRDVPTTFSGRPLEDLESTQTWMSNFFLTFPS